MKTTKSTIRLIERFTDPALIKGIKIGKDEEVQINIGGNKKLIIKQGSVTVM